MLIWVYIYVDQYEFIQYTFSLMIVSKKKTFFNKIVYYNIIKIPVIHHIQHNIYEIKVILANDLATCSNEINNNL